MLPNEAQGGSPKKRGYYPPFTVPCFSPTSFETYTFNAPPVGFFFGLRSFSLDCFGWLSCLEGFVFMSMVTFKHLRGLIGTVIPMHAHFLTVILFFSAVVNGERCSAQEVRFEASLPDLPAELKPLEQNIRENVLAAAEMWGEVVVAKPCSIEIVLRIMPWPARGFGHSMVGVPLREKVDGKALVEEGMAHELRTGIDPNGSGPDVELGFDPEYLKTMWWDPKPQSRKRPVPTHLLDAVSVIAHELGHAIAFNGRLDPKTGQPTRGEISPYDRRVRFDGVNFFWTGPAAMKVFRKEVPLSKTQTNYHHFGEPGPKLDRRLKDDLMNGIFMEHGKRYSVSALDVAILADCGLAVRK